MVWLVLLAACGPKTVECGPAACAEICATAQDPGLAGATAFEASLLEPLLDDVRAGIQPWSEEGIGLCRGSRTCEAYLGADAGELAPGAYVIRAELRVPDVGERGTWSVIFATECTSGGGEPERYTRTYEVIAPGGDRPYRLGALRRITSPSDAGPTSCTWSLTAPHPDGDKRYQGSWSTP
ncbi:MAG TPA: hypothetical protein ENK18_27130 [Deltaproteobacteria bacterium]|nr:hypothetical protein [Deltaproteobacteria bacterium]